MPAGRRSRLHDRYDVAPAMNTLQISPPAAGLSESELEARERFYPDWWMFDAQGAAAPEARPAYRVVVHSEAERDLAYRVKPPTIDAQIVLERP